MARYRRSPRCSWCYKEGHTKNHCPEIKEAAANGDAWAIRQVERQKKSVSNRQCSYCGETGHNKRGCSKLKADKVLWEQVVQTFHKERQEFMLEKGITIGSLVRWTNRTNKTETIAMITKIHTKSHDNKHFRVPSWDWMHEARTSNPPKFTEEVIYGHDRYNRVAPNVNDDIGVSIESMSGTGLGYWGDDAKATVDAAQFISATVVEVVS